MKKEIRFCAFTIAAAALSVLSFMKNDVHASETASVSPECTSYQFDNDAGYYISKGDKMESMSFGKKTCGTLKLSGDITSTSTSYPNCSLAVESSSSVSFSYYYDGWLEGRAKTEWNLNQDTATSVNGTSLNGSVGYGCMMVETSEDGNKYTSIGVKITDFLQENRIDFYTTGGYDSYVRVSLFYETKMKTGSKKDWTSPFTYKNKDVYAYKNHAEIYTLYLCRGDQKPVVHNLDADTSSYVNEGEGLTAELVSAGESLVDGSVTTTGFSVTRSPSYTTLVGHDECADYTTESFTENGTYEIRSISKLKTELPSQTIYVFNKEDKGLGTYFEEGYIVSGHRVYRNREWPVYDNNSVIKIKAVDDETPALYGTLTNITNNKTYCFDKGIRKEQIQSLEAGVYEGIFYSGNPEIAGSYYKYSFKFEIVNEKSSPAVNYTNLMNMDTLEQYKSEHLEVVYETTMGGYVCVCFDTSSYDDAFEYACEIQNRYIEKVSDGYYYKDKTNPEKKVKYTDLCELTKVRDMYAKTNVNTAYFNKNDGYTIRTLEDDSLDALERLNLKDTVHVIADESEKEKMKSSVKYLNNFTFISVGDFDSSQVLAYCYANKKTYSIQYGILVCEQLTESSVYKIIETNVYGDVKEYEATYVNDNTAALAYAANGYQTIIYSNADGMTCECDHFTVVQVTDKYDDQCLIMLTSDNYSREYTYFAKDFSLETYDEGTYKITCTNRLGQSFTITFIVSNDEEENTALDYSRLNELTASMLEGKNYTSETYSAYASAYNSAKEYGSQSMSQAEIDDYCDKLEKSIANLDEKTEEASVIQKENVSSKKDNKKYIYISVIAGILLVAASVFIAVKKRHHE